MQFKAHTPQAANQWWEIIRQAAGTVTNELPEGSVPTSPVTGNDSPSGATQNFHGEEKQPAPLQTQGLQNTGTATTDHATPGSTATPGTAATNSAAPGSAVTPGSAVPGEPGKY